MIEMKNNTPISMIEMKNNTPFPLLSFEKYGRYGLLFDVIAIKMSLRIKNGFYADLAEFLC